MSAARLVAEALIAVGVAAIVLLLALQQRDLRRFERRRQRRRERPNGH